MTGEMGLLIDRTDAKNSSSRGGEGGVAAAAGVLSPDAAETKGAMCGPTAVAGLQQFSRQRPGVLPITAVEYSTAACSVAAAAGQELLPLQRPRSAIQFAALQPNSIEEPFWWRLQLRRTLLLWAAAAAAATHQRPQRPSHNSSPRVLEHAQRRRLHRSLEGQKGQG